MYACNFSAVIPLIGLELISEQSVTNVPGLSEKLDLTDISMPVFFASSTERLCSTLAPNEE